VQLKQRGVWQVRRLKLKSAVLREALARGVASPGGLARAVYGGSPRDRQARIRAVKLRREIMKVKRSKTENDNRL